MSLPTSHAGWSAEAYREEAHMLLKYAAEWDQDKVDYGVDASESAAVCRRNAVGHEIRARRVEGSVPDEVCVVALALLQSWEGTPDVDELLKTAEALLCE